MKKILKWVGARAKERSTYSGLALIAAIAGANKLGLQIDQVGQAIVLITGGGLIAAPARAAN
jgi:hypothetical protein